MVILHRPGVTRQGDDDAPHHPTHTVEQEEGGHSKCQGGREGVEDGHHSDGGQDLQDDDRQLDGDLTEEAVESGDPHGPVPGEHPSLHLRDQKVGCQGERHEEEGERDHPRQHGQVAGGLQTAQQGRHTHQLEGGQVTLLGHQLQHPPACPPHRQQAHLGLYLVGGILQQTQIKSVRIKTTPQVTTLARKQSNSLNPTSKYLEPIV